MLANQRLAHAGAIQAGGGQALPCDHALRRVVHENQSREGCSAWPVDARALSFNSGEGQLLFCRGQSFKHSWCCYFLPQATDDPTASSALQRHTVARRQHSDFMPGVPRLTACGLGAGSWAARVSVFRRWQFLGFYRNSSQGDAISFMCEVCST